MTVEKSKPIMSAEVLNPFIVKQRLSLFQILKSVLLSFTLLPIRFLFMILTLLFAWVIGVITLPGITKEQALGIEPLNGWRRRWAKPFITKLARLVFFFGGWYWIPQKGCRASAKEAPILLVMPHSTFFDTVLVIALGCPSMVVKDSTERIPFFGRLVKYAQPLFVTSEDPNSRRKIAEKIRERVTSGKDFEQLLLFPEGGCGNRKALLQFKLGAFAPGVPVQPVFIRYKNDLDTCTWSWEGPGALKQLWLTLTQLSIHCELEFLPVYRPSEYERENPRFFADNIRSFVSSWTETPMSSFSVEDARFLKMAKENFLPPTAALVKLLRLRKSIGRHHIDLCDELLELKGKRKYFEKMRGNVKHMAFYLGLERCSEALNDFYRTLDQHETNSLDVRVYDAGLYLLRTDLKVREKLRRAFKVFGSENAPAEHLETILLYWKGVPTLKAFSQLDKFDPEELHSS